MAVIRTPHPPPTVTQLRQAVKRHGEYPGVLGDGTGNPYAGRSLYWVRFPIGTDENGLTVYTPARPVRYSGEASIIAREGVEVLVRVDPYDFAETITRGVPDYSLRANFDSRILNSSDPITKWSDVPQFIRLLARPVGGETAQITVQSNPFHLDDFGEPSTFSGTMPDDQIDLDSLGLIPAVGYHCLAVIFFDFVANGPVVKVSTTQSLGDALDITDYNECAAQMPHNEWLPLVSLDIGNGVATVSSLNIVEDLRTWLPTPRVYGFPGPIPAGKAILIRETHQEHVTRITVQGKLIIQGKLVVRSENKVIQKNEISAEVLTVQNKARINKQIWKPNATVQAVSAAGGITPAYSYLRIAGDGGPVDITADPQISAGIAGQLLILQGTSDVDYVDLKDDYGIHLQGEKLRLLENDVVGFIYNEDEEKYTEIFRNTPANEVTWPFASPAGALGAFYSGGFYHFSGANNDFDPAINWGTANAGYGAHFMIVLGEVAVDEITIAVTGTSMLDGGTRAATDTEDIVIPNGTAANSYFETVKKWIGQVAIETTTGTAKQCNYGWCKYWDRNNTRFRIIGSEALWVAGANDAGANISILHHKAAGWTYNAGADPTPPTPIADMQTDYDTEYELINGEPGAWKRDNLSTNVDGIGSEGIIVRRVTTANKAFEPGLCSMMIRVIPQ